MDADVKTFDVSVVISPHPKCQRCRRQVDDVAVHDYWPCYRICERCVGVLLEIKWPPFIQRSGEVGDSSADYYICVDEAEWHRIKNGLQSLPKESS